MTPFQILWHETVRSKHSNLCVGLDPAPPSQRPDQTFGVGLTKYQFCEQMIEQVAPYAAAIKINHHYVRDFSLSELQGLTSQIHSYGMLAIDDSKIADIGATNATALHHIKQEGFDATTYTPFPGNMAETVQSAHRLELGIISLVLMSNPEFLPTKTALFAGVAGSQYFAQQARACLCDGIVVAAPHGDVTDSDIEDLYGCYPSAIVLSPGFGAQGRLDIGRLKLFKHQLMANVGRDIIYHSDPRQRAHFWQGHLAKQIGLEV